LLAQNGLTTASNPEWPLLVPAGSVNQGEKNNLPLFVPENQEE
jgi:hypothetical protein